MAWFLFGELLCMAIPYMCGFIWLRFAVFM